MTTVTDPLSSPTPVANVAQPSAASDPLSSQNVFLQLLVAQLKNQDPTNPSDGTTLITQLAQFSELSNSTQMLSVLNAIQQSTATVAAAVTALPGAAKTS